MARGCRQAIARATLTLLLPVLLAPRAHASSVNLAAGLTLTSPRTASQTALFSYVGATGVLGYDQSLGRHWSVEADLDYHNRHYAVDYSLGVISFPVFVNYETEPWILGAGFYYAKVGQTVFNGSSGAQLQLQDLGLSTSDYGVIGQIGYELPVNRNGFLILVGRATHALSNSSTVASYGSFYWNQVQGLIGLKIVFGKMAHRQFDW